MYVEGRFVNIYKLIHIEIYTSKNHTTCKENEISKRLHPTIDEYTSEHVEQTNPVLTHYSKIRN